jgi:hypothetical protein
VAVVFKEKALAGQTNVTGICTVHEDVPVEDFRNLLLTPYLLNL